MSPAASMERAAASNPVSQEPSLHSAENRAAPGVRRRQYPGSAVLACGGVVLLFLLLQSPLPLRTAVRIGPDEDYEGAKVTLCLSGYRLYSQIWNDQPPLHTFLIMEIVKLTDKLERNRVPMRNAAPVAHVMLGPRVLTVAATALLLVSFFGLVLRGETAVCRRGQKGKAIWVAAVAVALLIASPAFLELGCSCMVEIPALAPAVAALWVLASRTVVGTAEGVQSSPPRGWSVGFTSKSPAFASFQGHTILSC